MNRPDSSDRQSDVTLLACIKCGTDFSYEGEAPDSPRCPKCGGTVFRSFSDHRGDEAADDFRESTGRETEPGSPSSEAGPGDVSDLKNF
ncbi:MAG: hypothetical protein ACREKN_01980 [Longimicrobiaceae bacterium]